MIVTNPKEGLSFLKPADRVGEFNLMYRSSAIFGWTDSRLTDDVTTALLDLLFDARFDRKLIAFHSERLFEYSVFYASADDGLIGRVSSAVRRAVLNELQRPTLAIEKLGDADYRVTFNGETRESTTLYQTPENVGAGLVKMINADRISGKWVVDMVRYFDSFNRSQHLLALLDDWSTGTDRIAVMRDLSIKPAPKPVLNLFKYHTNRPAANGYEQIEIVRGETSPLTNETTWKLKLVRGTNTDILLSGLSALTASRLALALNQLLHTVKPEDS